MSTPNRPAEAAGRGRKNLRATAVGALALAVFAAGAGAARAQPPSYTVQRCCALCPAASDPAAYNTGFLEANRQLLDGQVGWLFRTESDLTTRFGPDPGGYAELQRFAQALKTRGTELVLIYLPTRGLVHPRLLSPADRMRYNFEAARASYASALANFRAQGIIVPDLTPLLDEEPREDAYYFKRDHHWTPYGARRAARLVAQAVKAAPVYAGLTKKQFATLRNGMMRKTGTLQMAASRICGTGYSDQWVPTFGTALESGEGGGDALFGDESAPQATLIGTSFSKSAVSYNFDGYLQEYLGIEILNEAMAGTGFDGAMIQYLQSETFQKSPPRLLLWEVPSYYGLNERRFYREVIPLVHDGCRNKAAALSARKTLKRGGITEVLFNGGGRVLPIIGRRYLIDLKISDPQVRELKAQVWYMNGRKDQIKLERAKRVDTGGRFVTELRSDTDWGDLTMLSMDIELPPEAPDKLEIDAAVCERGPATQTYTALK